MRTRGGFEREQWGRVSYVWLYDRTNELLNWWSAGRDQTIPSTDWLNPGSPTEKQLTHGMSMVSVGAHIASNGMGSSGSQGTFLLAWCSLANFNPCTGKKIPTRDSVVWGFYGIFLCGLVGCQSRVLIYGYLWTLLGAATRPQSTCVQDSSDLQAARMTENPTKSIPRATSWS